MVAIIAFGFAFVACDDKGDGKDEQPELRNEEITVSNGKTVAVNGTLTRAEMDSVKNKLTTAINSALSGDDEFLKEDIESILGLNLTINLEKAVGYSRYKTASNIRNVFNINVDHVLTASPSDLLATITDATNAMFGGASAME